MTLNSYGLLSVLLPEVNPQHQEPTTGLSRFLANLAKGETVMLGKRNVSTAEIRSLPPERTSPRPRFSSSFQMI